MPVHAYVNGGRWLARCPDCPRGCDASQNASAGHRFRPVIWPGEAFVEQLLALLAPRPEAATNWLPGETLDFVRAENMEHGL
jgi:uncharacterized protein (DUF1499 family)